MAFPPSRPEGHLQTTPFAHWLWTRHPMWNDPRPEVFAERESHAEPAVVPTGDAGLPEGAAVRGPVAGALPAPGHATGRVLRFATILLREPHRHGRGLPVHGGAAATRRSGGAGRQDLDAGHAGGGDDATTGAGPDDRRTRGCAGVGARPVECRVAPAMERPGTSGVLRPQHPARCAHRGPRPAQGVGSRDRPQSGRGNRDLPDRRRTRGTRNRFPSRMPRPISPSRSNCAEPASIAPDTSTPDAYCEPAAG